MACAACDAMADGKRCLSHTCPDCSGSHAPSEPCDD